MMLKKLKRILSIKCREKNSPPSAFGTSPRVRGEEFIVTLPTYIAPPASGESCPGGTEGGPAGSPKGKHKRQYWHLLLAFLFSTFLTACNQQSNITDSTGATINLKSYQGKWLVINYWADWCTPCLQELPALNAFYKKHKKQLVVLGVNFDNLPNNKIKKFKQQYALNFPMTNNFPIENYGVKNIPNLPTTFIISPEGKLTSTLIGPQNEFSLTQEINFKDNA